MSSVNNPKSVYVVYTENEAELRANAPAIRLLAKQHEILYVRESWQTESQTKSQLVDELRRIIFKYSADTGGNLIAPYVFILKSRALAKELEKQNIVISGFLGSKPEIVTSRPDFADVHMRVARICKKCESVISETTNMVTKKRATIVRSQHIMDLGSEVQYVNGKLNINIADSCAQGC